MANTLKVQIDNIVGSGLASTVYDDWIRAGSRTIVDVLKQEDLERHSSSVAIPITTGLSVVLYRIWRILVGGYDAQQYPAGYETQIVDSNSFYKSSAFTPGYIINAGTLKTYNGANCAGTLIGIAYPTVIDSSVDEEIVGVPENMHYAVILYSAIQARIKQMTELIKTTLAGFTLSNIDLSGITAPVAPAYTGVSYTHASATDVSATTIGTIPSAPTFNNSISPSDITSALTSFDAAMTVEDIELAQSHLQKANTMLNKYQALIQENLGSFNKDIKKFESDVQKVLQQSQTTLQEAQQNAKNTNDIDVINRAKDMEVTIQNNSVLLNNYQAEIQKYSQRVNALVSQYGANIQIFQAEVQKVFGQHTAYAVGLQQLQSEYHEVINLYLGGKPSMVQSQGE